MVPIAARVPAHNDAEVAELAKVLTVSQVRRVVTKYPFPNPTTGTADASGPMGSASANADRTRPDGAPIDPAAPGSAARGAEAAGRVAFGWADDGRFWAHADLSADAGALMEQALREAKDRLLRVAGDPDEMTVVTNADALADLCGRSLQQLSETGPASRADRYRVYLHLDTDRAWINAGPTVPPSLLEKLSCDGVVQPVWQTDGHPVNVGRAQRIVPTRTRRLVEDRDRSCRFPACTASAWLEVHHVVHWRHGGPTDTCNLICLCPSHHDAHHRGSYSISGDANHPETMRFVDTDGSPIGARPPTPPTGPLPRLTDPHRWRHPGGERLDLRWISFRSPPDPNHQLN